jgi:7-cyano-7-deazaguanine synthase
MKTAIVVFSGGPDSTAAALFALAEGYSPTLLTFQFKGKEQYGEIFSSMKVAELLKLPHEIIDFKSPMGSFSPLVYILMHAGSAIRESDKSISHRAPFGGGMVLATACSYALYNGIDTVIWGATLDDQHGGNLEYSQEFADKMAETVSFGTGTQMKILVPFTRLHKHQVFAHFKGKESLFAHTWSCKKETNIQTGACKACIARRVAARLAGVEDSTRYIMPQLASPFTAEQMSHPESLTDDDFIIMSSETSWGASGPPPNFDSAQV